MLSFSTQLQHWCFFLRAVCCSSAVAVPEGFGLPLQKLEKMCLKPHHSLPRFRNLCTQSRGPWCQGCVEHGPVQKHPKSYQSASGQRGAAMRALDSATRLRRLNGVAVKRDSPCCARSKARKMAEEDGSLRRSGKVVSLFAIGSA